MGAEVSQGFGHGPVPEGPQGPQGPQGGILDMLGGGHCQPASRLEGGGEGGMRAPGHGALVVWRKPGQEGGVVVDP